MKAIILTNDRKVKRKRIKAGAQSFSFKGKLYDIDAEAVFMAEWPKKNLKKPTPRIFYFENSPGPVKYVTSGKRVDESFKSLEKHIKINAVNQQSNPSVGSKVAPIIEALGNFLSFYNIFMLIVAGSIIYSWLQGLLMG